MNRKAFRRALHAPTHYPEVCYILALLVSSLVVAYSLWWLIAFIPVTFYVIFGIDHLRSDIRILSMNNRIVVEALHLSERDLLEAQAKVEAAGAASTN